VPSGTLTARLAADASRVTQGDRASDTIDVRDWLGGSTKALVAEECIGLGRYGKVLTLLSSGSIGQTEYSDDDEDEEKLIESWTPKFRR